MQWSVVLSTIREYVRTMCSGVWSLVPLGNTSGQSAVECSPQYHQKTCQGKVQLECGPQNHYGTCQDEVQWSVVLSTIKEPVKMKSSGVCSTVPSGNLSGQIAVECGL